MVSVYFANTVLIINAKSSVFPNMNSTYFPYPGENLSKKIIFSSSVEEVLQNVFFWPAFGGFVAN